MEKDEKIRLIALANDENAFLEDRKEAILQLTAVPESDVQVCLAELLQSRVTAIRYYARRSLNSIKTPGPRIHSQPRAPQGYSDSLEDQVLALKAETDPFKVGQLLTTIGRSADSTLIPIVQAYLDDENPRVRAGAIEALENIGNPEVAQMIMPFLKDEDNRVKGNAAKFLWKYSPDEVFDEMCEMLSSGKEWEEASALYVLSSMETNRKDELLAIAVKSVNPEIRKKAAVMLEKEKSRLESSKKILDSYMKASPVAAKREESSKMASMNTKKPGTSSKGMGRLFAGVTRVAVYVVVLVMAGYGGFEAYKGFRVGERISESARNEAIGKLNNTGFENSGTTTGTAVAQTGIGEPQTLSTGAGGDGSILAGGPADIQGTAGVEIAVVTDVGSIGSGAVAAGKRGAGKKPGAGALGFDTTGVSLNLGLGPGDLNMGPVIRRKAASDAEGRRDWVAAAKIYMALAVELASKNPQSAASDYYSAANAFMSQDLKGEAFLAYVMAVVLKREIMEKPDNGIVAGGEKFAVSLKGGPKSQLADEILAMISYFNSSLSSCRILCKQVLARGDKVQNKDLLKAIDAMAAADIDKVKVKLPTKVATGGQGEKSRPDISAEMKKAGELVKKAEPAKAIDALREALAKDPANLEVLNMMVELNISTDSYDEAIETLEKMAEIDSRDPQTHFRLSDLYSQKQQTVKAKKSLGMVLLCDTDGTFSQAAREKILKIEGISQ